jgi:hypothetical protein
MRDRDGFRTQRDLPWKWQYAKVGLIDDLWKNRHTLKSKAYSYRLIYDKGWHGGNRSKANTPDALTREEWIACGLCGQPDSQHHWIRECQHPPTVVVRQAAERQVQDLLLELRQPTHKRTKKDPDLLHLAETLDHFATSAVHGEHLWLGIIYTNMIHHFQEHGLTFPITDHKISPRANRWKQMVLKIISPLLKAAKEMWSIKESSRRETLLGVPTDADRVRHARTARHRADIRSWFSRLEHKVGQIRYRSEQSHNIDTTRTDDLLRPFPSSPLVTMRLRRNLPPLPAPSAPPPVRWRVTRMQEYFSLNRQHSSVMMTKQPLPNGSIPRAYERSLFTGKWDNGIDLSWLPAKQAEGMDNSHGPRPSSEPTQDGYGIPLCNIDITSSSSPNSHSSNSSNNLFNFNSINISSNSSFIFRDSDSRSTASNSSEDDATKRRGVG